LDAEKKMKSVQRCFAGSVIGAAIIVGGLLLSSGGAFAAPPAAQAAKPADDPAKVALARQFIMLYHPKTDPKLIAERLDIVMPRQIAMAKRRDPKLDEKAFEKETRARILAGNEKSLDHQAHVVSRHFSMQELKDLVAFFSTPLGRKVGLEAMKIQQEMLLDNRKARKAAIENGEITIGPAPTKTPAPPAKKSK